MGSNCFKESQLSQIKVYNFVKFIEKIHFLAKFFRGSEIQSLNFKLDLSPDLQSHRQPEIELQLERTVS
jgi:hypothetical protein